MRHIVSPADRITAETVQQAYLSGIDRIPWQVHPRHNGGELILERAVSDSTNLHIPWQVAGHGQIMLSTGTLMERPAPYHLPLELARGEISQLRNQVAEWQVIGLIVPETVHEAVAEATEHFSRAVVAPHDSEQSVEAADKALCLALDAADLLADCYTEQALAARRRVSQKLPTFLGADLGVAPLDDHAAKQFLQTFNAANVPLVWRGIETSEGNYYWDITDKQVQWCRAHGLTVCGGPLLQFDERSIPDWLYLYEDDFESVMAFASEFVQAAVKRYRGKIDFWQCAGRVNTAEVLSLSEEEKIKLTARAIELTRSIDADVPVVVSFDQPWAEYLSRRGDSQR